MQPSDRSAILNMLNYHCRCVVTWQYSLRIANWLKILNQAASTRCSGDNKEKLPTNIRSEYANDFCHDRRSTSRRLCRKRSNNVARHDKTPVKSILLSRDKNILSRDMSFMSRRVTLCCDFYTFRSCNTCTFSLPTFAVLRHTT